MSHLLLASCPHCHLVISTGWTEPGLAPRVFCGACDARLGVSAWDETHIARPEPLALFHMTRAPREVQSKRGRVRKTRLEPTSVDSGVRVPLVEHLRETPSGDDTLVWEPDFAGCSCPGCGAVGRIRTWAEAVARCPRCGAGPMDLHPTP